MKIGQKSKVSSKIPTASIADIVFLLLIFFITVSVFKEYVGLQVKLPPAKATQKIETKRLVSYIWISKDKEICIDDMPGLHLAGIRPIISQKVSENPAIIVSIRADEKVQYGYVAEVMEKLKEANALRVNFATTSEREGG
ncbi:biopolymer transporter ExbD [bacterium]|nr:biopolymer transporter ExbD [bacterium]